MPSTVYHLLLVQWPVGVARTAPDVERYVGWWCILNCFTLSSLPCFYVFCWSAIPTSF